MPDAKNVSPGSLPSTDAPGNGVRRPRHRVRPLLAWLAVAATVITVATIEAGRLLHGLSHGSVPVLRVYGSPSGLVVSPNGRTLYLADSSANAITPVAAATGKADRSIPISGGSPGNYWSHDMAVTPDGDTLFTCVYDDKAGVNLPLARVDLRTGKEAGQVRAPGGVAAFVMSRDSKTLYVISGDNTLVAVSVATGRTERQFPVPKSLLRGATAMVLSPDGTTLYVAAAGTVTPVNLRTGIPGPAVTGVGGPASGPAGSGPESLAITPDGRTVFVAVDGVVPISGNPYPSHLVVIDTAAHRVRANLLWQAPPMYLQMTPSGKTVWVISTLARTMETADDTVTPLTVASDQPGPSFHTSGLNNGLMNDDPTGAALSPDGRTLYVTVEYGLETFHVGLPSAQRQLLLSNCGQGIRTCGQATEPGPHCLRCSE